MVNGRWVTERVETMYQTVANGATMGGVPQYRPGPPFYCCPSEMRTVYDAAPEYRAYMAFFEYPLVPVRCRRFIWHCFLGRVVSVASILWSTRGKKGGEHIQESTPRRA
jgi:hypothetical protein